jgi:hypothetical protein
MGCTDTLRACDGLGAVVAKSQRGGHGSGRALESETMDSSVRT